MKITKVCTAIITLETPEEVAIFRIVLRQTGLMYGDAEELRANLVALIDEVQL